MVPLPRNPGTRYPLAVPLPESLPDQLFVLACDPERERLVRRMEAGYILRAAALVELQLRGNLRDGVGGPVVMGSTTPSEPVLRQVMEEIATSRPRRWGHWVQANT